MNSIYRNIRKFLYVFGIAFSRGELLLPLLHDARTSHHTCSKTANSINSKPIILLILKVPCSY